MPTLAQLNGALQSSAGSLCRNCYCAVQQPTRMLFFTPAFDLAFYGTPTSGVPDGYSGYHPPDPFGSEYYVSEIKTEWPSDVLPDPLYSVRHVEVSAMFWSFWFLVNEDYHTSAYVFLTVNAEVEFEEDVWTPSSATVVYYEGDWQLLISFPPTYPGWATLPMTVQSHSDYSSWLETGDPLNAVVGLAYHEEDPGLT